ncbi:hypothetical protein [Pseudomonas atacamensis]|uniref:hypothetical protein n=1 Tax=Pseudomonas atacamensis TaxID=2565368 RepID=UPI0021D9974E|nr:hypothetical protein [Pseudomonas atacamensis]
MSIFVKAMHRDRYQEGLIHNTNSYNYSRSAGVTNREDSRLFDLIISISESTGTGFGLLVSFAIKSHRKLLSELTIDLIQIGKPLDLLLAEELKPSGKMVEASQLKNLMDLASRADLQAPNGKISCRFWEHLYEAVRCRDFQDKPKRLKSFFVFRDLETAYWYRTKHELGEVICQVKILQSRVEFEADMTILDSVDETYNYAQAWPEITRYWRQELSENPRIEVLIQGRFKILAMCN